MLMLKGMSQHTSKKQLGLKMIHEECLTDASQRLPQLLAECDDFYLEFLALPVSTQSIHSAAVFSLDTPPPDVLPCMDGCCKKGGIQITNLVDQVIQNCLKAASMTSNTKFQTKLIMTCPGINTSGTFSRTPCQKQYQVRLIGRVRAASRTGLRLFQPAFDPQLAATGKPRLKLIPVT